MADEIRIKSNRARFSTIYHDVTSSGKLTIKEVGLFVALMRYANHETNEAFPSQKRLADELNTSVSTIRRTLESMAAKGVLMIEPRFNEKNAQTSNLYTIIDDPDLWLSELDLQNGIKKVPVSTSTDRQISEYEADTSDNLIYLQEKDTTSINLCQSSTEKYSIDWLKNHYDYDALVDVMDQSDADMLMHYIYDILNSKQKTMTIEGTPLMSEGVIQHILELTHEDLEFVMDKFKSSTKKIRNTKAYIRTIMYNAKAQSNAEIKNTLHRDNVI